jgi:hypothetical protein
MDWDALRLRLARLKDSVSAEIDNYPAPIAACDAQFNYLLERRQLLSEALAGLDSASEDGSSTVEAFITDLPNLGDDWR